MLQRQDISCWGEQPTRKSEPIGESQPHGEVGAMLRPPLLPLTHVCLYILLGIPQDTCQVQLSMMPDAFDDQYIGCEVEMDGRAPGLLMEEMSMSTLLSTVWKNSEQKWQSVKTKLSLPSGFKDEHGRAIVAYTDNAFHGELNQAVRENGKSPADYMDKFHFKAFHYYLTRALRLLRGSCGVMYKETVYRGTDVSHTGSGIIRFGFFASSSFDRAKAEKFGKATVFTIHTCLGVDIRNFSHFQEEEEVLIPVHEQFSASPGQGSHSFVLWSTNQTCSNFNCAFLNRTKNSVCADNSATGGGIAFPSQMSPSLFGGSIILLHVAALKLFASF
ncbi:ecto-ADP-ribosyltransferase 5-like [Emydura macquarii macquarii]|uniref:ecto-ADP-ribosyltransferase 5-like n=1 Tax=Emydura macquarii macquarii TaxID=1129001 RepID=UPI00352AAA69